MVPKSKWKTCFLITSHVSILLEMRQTGYSLTRSYLWKYICVQINRLRTLRLSEHISWVCIYKFCFYHKNKEWFQRSIQFTKHECLLLLYPIWKKNTIINCMLSCKTQKNGPHKWMLVLHYGPYNEGKDKKQHP